MATTILYSLDLFDEVDTTCIFFFFLLVSLFIFIYQKQNVQAQDQSGAWEV